MIHAKLAYESSIIR